MLANASLFSIYQAGIFTYETDVINIVSHQLCSNSRIRKGWLARFKPNNNLINSCMFFQLWLQGARPRLWALGWKSRRGLVRPGTQSPLCALRVETQNRKHQIFLKHIFYFFCLQLQSVKSEINNVSIAASKGHRSLLKEIQKVQQDVKSYKVRFQSQFHSSY